MGFSHLLSLYLLGQSFVTGFLSFPPMSIAFNFERELGAAPQTMPEVVSDTSRR